MSRKKRIRYAVVGLGHLSQSAILPAFGRTRHSELAVLITGDPKKADSLRRKYQAPVYGYEDYELALENEAVDAAFIVLPNTLHREYTERTAKAGVHVLCEKPMAADAHDCKAMIQTCEKAGVELMIAYRLHFTEPHMRAVEAVRSGRLGEVRIFHSVFAMQVSKGNIRTQQETGGGPLLDIGVYCINAARYFFGDDPVEVMAMADSSDDPRFSEVDEMVGAILRFPKNRLASFVCSFGAQDISQFSLIGTGGILRGNPAFDYTVPLQWTLEQGKRTLEKKFPKNDQFAAEMDYFSNCLLNHRKPEPSGIEGLIDLEIIEAINRSRKSGRAVSLRPPKKTQRPGPRQIIRRATLKKHPKLVKAQPPHR